MDIVQILITCGVPTALTGFFFWLIQRKITEQAKKTEEAEKERERKQIEREKNREKLMLMLLQTNRATIVLSEATAKAVQRIPDAHCNGDMHAALEYVEKVQHKQKDFLVELGIHSIYD